MPLHKKDDYIPIKCEGWNGKFLYPEGAVNNVSKIRRQNQNVTNTNNFYGFNTEPIVLPTTWDGTFARSGETRMQPQRNCSDDQNYFDYDTSTTVLPPTWNGEFVTDSNDVRIKPERNYSDPRDFAEANRFKLVKQ
ncbi:uncharacterized protein LOC115621367 [Scaptodrosophila lebanonensis]|uniref:Uncharacterized protein LOC115621367 n=1 Tax=Drosophila lebanonensis TaxID=7225 RepID=A0A6J2T6E9_DROLE|nr:uncharacterized protein LOC115621367 [Scaptodrosophila lebanonensis]